MPKKAEELGPLAVSRLTSPGLHFVGGVDGLILQVEPSGGRSWILRATVGGKRRDMGLGGFPDVTLAAAREAARDARAKIKKGIDPIEEGKSARAALKAAQENAFTFKAATKTYIQTHEAAWTNPKHAQQWRNSLATHAEPHIGDMLVRDIELADVMKVLDSIWRTKTETASRVRGRIESILDWSTTMGYRSGLNPARWKGHLSNVLPARGKIAKETHHPAMPLGELGRFMVELRKHAGVGAKALEFGILTAARSAEIRGATAQEFDLDACLWVVPAERMKAKKEHRVPLSKEALAIVKAQIGDARSGLVFPAPRGGILSDGTLSAVLKRMEEEYVPHGFRSTFRDWASEHTNYPSEMAEMALAHTISDKVEAAYRRGDLFMKRRQMMADWAAFVNTVQSKGGDVVDLESKRS